MKKIGLLSDTHSFIPDKALSFLSECDEIWHAGDIGNMETARKLEAVKPLRAVYGNIDGAELRAVYPLYQNFLCEDVRVLMLHIGGYPGRYTKEALQLIRAYRPTLFISGHSHILKVMNDPAFNLLHMNPGAAGNYGFHIVSTVLRFAIDGARISDLEILEMKK